MFDEKTEALVKVEESLLAGDHVSLYENAYCFDADIQMQLVAEHIDGDDALILQCLQVLQLMCWSQI